MFNLPPPPGLRGLDPDRPVHVYVRHLPHWRQDGATYFVTYRLEDSLPQAKLTELRHLRAEWERRHPPPRTDEQLQELARETMQRAEQWLDQGMGRCVLREKLPADLMEEAMHRFDGERYELDCYVVMPNHVHLVLRPDAPADFPLEKILQSWKAYTSRRINAHVGSTGTLWQQESFDRIIRDEEHLWNTIQYIGRNPQLAGLEPNGYRLWIRPAWAELGWRFQASV